MKTKWIIMAIGLILAGVLRTVAADAPSQTNEPPRHGIAWLDDKEDVHITYKKEQKGTPIALEYMLFDSDKKITGPAGGGMIFTMKETPVRMVMTFGPKPMFSRFSNIEVDVRDLHEKRKTVRLFEQVTPEKVYCSWIDLVIGKNNTLTIGTDYLVVADGKTQDGAPFVSVQFEQKTAAGENEQLLKDFTIHLSRNGKDIGTTTLQKPVQLKAARGENDVLQWYISDKQGAKLKEGKMGFPVTGGTPDVVLYVVDLAKVVEASKK